MVCRSWFQIEIDASIRYMMKVILFVSEATALQMEPDRGSALISITEPHRVAPLAGLDDWGALLRIQFADAEYDSAMIDRLRARGKAFDAEVKGFPRASTSKMLLEFLWQVRGRHDLDKLVIHCHAGKRRSAAVAKFAAEMFPEAACPPTDGYNETVYRLLKDPMAIPNAVKPLSWWRRQLERLFGQ